MGDTDQQRQAKALEGILGQMTFIASELRKGNEIQQAILSELNVLSLQQKPLEDRFNERIINILKDPSMFDVPPTTEEVMKVGLHVLKSKSETTAKRDL